jgi:hypothetical protein
MQEDDGPLDRNLEALASRLGRSLELRDGDGRFTVERGSDVPALLIRDRSGVSIPVHGRRDPWRDANRQLEAALDGRPMPSLVILIGAGLGFLLDVIRTRSDATKVLAIEPDASCARATLARADWSDWISTERLTILWGPEFAGKIDAWRHLRGLGPECEPLVLVNAVIERVWPEAVERAQVCLRRILSDYQANAQAARKLGGRYLVNTLANLAVIERSGDVADLGGRFRDTAAILVAAGPSLDENIDALWEMQDRALVIAADTALRPLLEAGIEPHLVVALDPSELNARHLTNLPPCPSTTLVAEGSLHPTAFEHFKGRVVVFQVSDHHPWPWLRDHGVVRGRLGAWGSVLTSTFDLAVRIGCDPILFAGADLAFTRGQPYCRGTAFEEDWAVAVGCGAELPTLWRDHIARRSVITTRDVRGAEAESSASLVSFRDWLADQIARLDGREVINCTQAGILYGPRVGQARLESVLRHRSRRDDLTERIRKAVERPVEFRPEGAARDGVALGRSLDHELEHGDLAAWASFAGLAPSALASEIERVAGLAAGHAVRTASSSGPVVVPTGTMTRPVRHTHAPEIARRWRATLLDEPLPEWAAGGGSPEELREAPVVGPQELDRAMAGLPLTALIGSAELLERQGHYARAEAVYRHMVTRAAASSDEDWLRRAQFGQLRSCYLGGRLPEALAVYDGAPSLQGNEFALQWAANIWCYQGTDEEAVPAIRRIIAEYPDTRGPRLSLAVRLAMAGNLQTAFDLVDADEPRWSNSANSFIPEFVRGICRRVHGNADEAMGVFRDLAAEFPGAAIEYLAAAAVSAQPALFEPALQVAQNALAGRTFAVVVLVPDVQSRLVDDAIASLVPNLSVGGTTVETRAVSPYARWVSVATRAR